MNAADLSRRLAPFARLSDRTAITPNYRVLALAKDHVRAIAPFGAMRVLADLGLEREVYVAADGFLAQLRALPDAELTFDIAGERLRWTCGDASRGTLALFPPEQLDVPAPAFVGPVSETPLNAPAFATALEIGALAASAAGRSFGLDGVQLRNIDNQAYAFATDNSVLSACCLGPALPLASADAVVTLKIDAVRLLTALFKQADEAFISCDATSLYAVTPDTELLLHQVAPLRADLATIASEYQNGDHRVPLHREAVAAFLKRAEALAENQQQALVEISVADGVARLSFDEISGSTEEHYLTPDAPEGQIPPVRIAAARLAAALAHATHLIFDYATKQVLVLSGPGNFRFVISGTQR